MFGGTFRVGLGAGLLTLGTVAVGAAPAHADEQPCGDGTAIGVYLYHDIDFGYSCSYFPSSSPSATTWTIGDNTASSIQIVGNCTATLYDKPHYKHRLQTFTASADDFLSGAYPKSLNDSTSSIRVSYS